MPLPQSKANELIEELNKLNRTEQKNPFALKQIKAEVEKLRKTDALSAYVILGMIACIERDVEAMIAHHKNAIQLSPGDFGAKFNFGNSLHNLGFFSEACKYHVSAYKLDRGNLTFLDTTIDNMAAAGRMHEVKSWIEEWEKLNPGKIHPKHNHITALCKLLDETEIPDSLAESLQETAMALLRENKIYGCPITTEILSDEGTLISYEISVPASLKTVAGYNYELSNRIAEKFDDPRSDKIVFSFSIDYSARVNERKTA